MSRMLRKRLQSLAEIIAREFAIAARREALKAAEIILEGALQGVRAAIAREGKHNG